LTSRFGWFLTPLTRAIRAYTGNAECVPHARLVIHHEDAAQAPLEEDLRHINPVRARLLMIWGPAEGWGNPLVGTQYDPVIRQKIEIERRHERQTRREERHRAHLVRRATHPEREEHCTPDAD
jgi:hypothetical protein